MSHSIWFNPYPKYMTFFFNRLDNEKWLKNTAAKKEIKRWDWRKTTETIAKREQVLWRCAFCQAYSAHADGMTVEKVGKQS